MDKIGKIQMMNIGCVKVLFVYVVVCHCDTYVHVLHDINKYDVCLYLVVDRFLHICVYN